MNTLSVSHISPEEVSAMTENSMAELAQRLEQDDYADAFAGLQDWHLLRAIAFQRPELAENYMHLLDLEAFDEE
ncbi:DUF2555 domain-containing protein [Leptolyngbya sp. PCC 6406]|uniref:protein IsiD n=1 Tax=Leptolyngbya sp. PCC 6406 TaxID=1173264 RepID=UPI0002AC0E36|nr:DUF2555 domain-containing protein [Leptolyngbya sp. PCC 6406]